MPAGVGRSMQDEAHPAPGFSNDGDLPPGGAVEGPLLPLLQPLLRVLLSVQMN